MEGTGGGRKEEGGRKREMKGGRWVGVGLSLLWAAGACAHCHSWGGEVALITASGVEVNSSSLLVGWRRTVVVIHMSLWALITIAGVWWGAPCHGWGGIVGAWHCLCHCVVALVMLWLVVIICGQLLGSLLWAVMASWWVVVVVVMSGHWHLFVGGS